MFVFVGVPRIELGSHAPEACILPLYYTPNGKNYSIYAIKEKGRAQRGLFLILMDGDF